MNLKLFLVALTLFSIPSCTEDYSQYKEELYQANETQRYNTRNAFEQFSRQVERENRNLNEAFKQVKDYYWGNLRSDAFADLLINELQNTDKLNLKKYDKSLKSKINTLKKSSNLSAKDLLELENLLDRLHFYEDKEEEIYREIRYNTYLKLEKYYFKMHANKTIRNNTSNAIKVGKEYKMILKSSKYNKNFEHLEYDSIQFLVDGVEAEVDYSLKTIQEIGILKFTPQQVGIYTIKGERDIVLNSNPQKRIANPFFYQKNVQK